MNEISKETIYEIMKASGWDNLENPSKDMKNFATRFTGRIYTLFKNEAQELLELCNRMSYHVEYELCEKIDKAADGIEKVFSALEGHINKCVQMQFQTVRARDGYLLYIALKKAGATNEEAMRMVDCFYLGKENIMEKENPEPIPDLDILDKPKYEHHVISRKPGGKDCVVTKEVTPEEKQFMQQVMRRVISHGK